MKVFRNFSDLGDKSGLRGVHMGKILINITIKTFKSQIFASDLLDNPHHASQLHLYLLCYQYYSS